jgi:hypothetical protein
MKFSWGTGILIFLIMFVSAAMVFFVFAMRQEVSLVHEDYYEKGVDHGQKMEVDARSAIYRDSIRTVQEEALFQVWFSQSMAISIDSGNMVFFRPSNSSLDLEWYFLKPTLPLSVPKNELISGRYILKLKWYSGGIEYGMDEAVFIE